MAHCPLALLSDLKHELDQIRKLPRIKEPKEGIFYQGARGFLHFHVKDGRRWADVRDGRDWGSPLDIPFGAGRAVRQKFITEVLRRHRTCGDST